MNKCQRSLRIDRRCKLICQSSALVQDEVIERSKHAQGLGADALMILPPYIEGPEDDDGLFAFYQAIDAAIREVGEETGIQDLDMEWGERFLDTGPYSRGKTARYYLARTEQESVVMGPSPVTGQPEHHEWRWVSFDEAHDLASPRVRTVVTWSRQIIGA